MKSLASAAVIVIALFAATPVVHRSQSLYAQAGRQPREAPKPQPSGGQARPQTPPTPPPSRPETPAASRPSGPPQSTGEPELKRRKQ